MPEFTQHDPQTAFVRNEPEPCLDLEAGADTLTTADLDLHPPANGSRYRRIEAWTSDNLPNPRDLFVYLPEAYLSEPDRRFPILVLHDGQNLFDPDLSYVKGQTWQCGSTLDASTRAGLVEPTVLLGVANTGCHRMSEYTPTPDQRLGGGRGPDYARLLVEELLPVAHRDLRLLSGPRNTGLAGSSLGGLISLAIGLHYPDIFGKLGVLSPSLWWNRRAILDQVRDMPGKLPLRIWLDMGTAEGQVHVRDTDLLAHLLEDRGWHLDGASTPPQPQGTKRFGSPFERRRTTDPAEPADLHYERVPGAFHNEAAWAARFGDVLRFLFPA